MTRCDEMMRPQWPHIIAMPMAVNVPGADFDALPAAEAVSPKRATASSEYMMMIQKNPRDKAIVREVGEELKRVRGKWTWNS